MGCVERGSRWAVERGPPAQLRPHLLQPELQHVRAGRHVVHVEPHGAAQQAQQQPGGVRVLGRLWPCGRSQRHAGGGGRGARCWRSDVLAGAGKGGTVGRSHRRPRRPSEARERRGHEPPTRVRRGSDARTCQRPLPHPCSRPRTWRCRRGGGAWPAPVRLRAAPRPPARATRATPCSQDQAPTPRLCVSVWVSPRQQHHHPPRTAAATVSKETGRCTENKASERKKSTHAPTVRMLRLGGGACRSPNAATHSSRPGSGATSRAVPVVTLPSTHGAHASAVVLPAALPSRCCAPGWPTGTHSREQRWRNTAPPLGKHAPPPPPLPASSAPPQTHRRGGVRAPHGAHLNPSSTSSARPSPKTPSSARHPTSPSSFPPSPIPSLPKSRSRCRCAHAPSSRGSGGCSRCGCGHGASSLSAPAGPRWPPRRPSPSAPGAETPPACCAAGLVAHAASVRCSHAPLLSCST